MLHYGASVIGSSHINKESVCQDNICYTDNGKVFISAISDGLGSCKYSDVGSKILVTTAVSFIVNELEFIQYFFLKT